MGNGREKNEISMQEKFKYFIPQKSLGNRSHELFDYVGQKN